MATRAGEWVQVRMADFTWEKPQGNWKGQSDWGSLEEEAGPNHREAGWHPEGDGEPSGGLSGTHGTCSALHDQGLYSGKLAQPPDGEWVRGTAGPGQEGATVAGFQGCDDNSLHQGSSKRNNDCAYHYGITQRTFTALKILCALSIHPSLPPKPWQPLIFLFLYIFAFFRCVIWLHLYSIRFFQIDFSLLGICT